MCESGVVRMSPQVVLKLTIVALVSLLAARVAGAQVSAVALEARLAGGVPAYGEGFCGQFTKGSGTHEIDSLADAVNLLDDLSGAPNRSSPDRTFFDIVPICDLHDGVDASTGRQSAFNGLFPWSDPADSWTTATCQSHGGGSLGANRFAMRLRGDFLVPSAGTYTFALRTDDGYRLSIGGNTVVETTVLRSTAIDTHRVSFSEAGRYPIEVIYFENDVHAVFEVYVAASDVAFVSNSDNAAVAASGGVDLVGRTYDTLPAAFSVLSSAHVDLPTWLGASDNDCGDYVGAPSSICTVPSTDAAANCGNGRLDAYSDAGSEGCDDGNKVDGDGCSATCLLESGFLCLRHPSVCATDIDGDGVSNDDETDIGSDPYDGDTDGDGVGDADEIGGAGNPTDSDGDGTPDVLDTDADNDGISDADDTNDNDGPSGDLDGDGVRNGDDADDNDGPNGDLDGDGVSNEDDTNDNDGPTGDLDGDGVANEDDANDDDGPTGDLDGDGVANEDDTNDNDGPSGDLDGDGVSNEDDADDNDGSAGDVDGDGEPNGSDPTPNGEEPSGGDDSGDDAGNGGTGGATGGNTGGGGGSNGGTGGGTDPGQDAGGDDLTDEGGVGIGGSGGCAATSPSGLSPLAMLAVGLFMVRRKRP